MVRTPFKSTCLNSPHLSGSLHFSGSYASSKGLRSLTLDVPLLSFEEGRHQRIMRTDIDIISNAIARPID